MGGFSKGVGFQKGGRFKMGVVLKEERFKRRSKGRGSQKGGFFFFFQ